MLKAADGGGLEGNKQKEEQVRHYIYCGEWGGDGKDDHSESTGVRTPRQRQCPTICMIRFMEMSLRARRAQPAQLYPVLCAVESPLKSLFILEKVTKGMSVVEVTPLFH